MTGPSSSGLPDLDEAGLPDGLVMSRQSQIVYPRRSHDHAISGVTVECLREILYRDHGSRQCALKIVTEMSIFKL